jgi:hypothetical protein
VTILVWLIVASFVALIIFCLWWWRRSVRRLRFATYDRDEDVLTVTWNTSAAPPDSADAFLNAVTVNAPIRLIYAGGPFGELKSAKRRSCTSAAPMRLNERER